MKNNKSYPKNAKSLSFPNALVGNPRQKHSGTSPDEDVNVPPTTNGSPRYEGTKTFGGDSFGIGSKHNRLTAGFSIIEVTVAALIFALTAVGIVSTVSSLRTPSAISEKDLLAAYYGQNILDDLRAKVDERTWLNASNPLSVGTHTLPPRGIYNAVYTATDDGTGRTVVLNITW